MIFAPVIIPTLNRDEHFIRCVESLKRNRFAENTDLVIGVDYPPSVEYEAGNIAIREYVSGLTGFNKVIVFFRESNCGAHLNATLLREYVSENYDRFIFSEDDNEYSPNFLSYMNCMLERYEDDKSVLAVCGYLPIQCAFSPKNGFFKSSYISAWGVGYWKSKRFLFGTIGSENYIKMVLFSWKKSIKLFRLRAASLNGFLTMFFKKIVYGDIMKTAEMLLENECSIFPSISKVRNWGHDGTGLHGGLSQDDIYKRQTIDDNTSWDYDNSIELQNITIASKADFGFFKSHLILVRYFIFRLFRIDCFRWFKKH